MSSLCNQISMSVLTPNYLLAVLNAISSARPIPFALSIPKQKQNVSCRFIDEKANVRFTHVSMQVLVKAFKPLQQSENGEGSMKLWHTSTHRSKFDILGSSNDLQAAMMSLPSGSKSEESVTNEHPKAEQWLYVISGTGIARIGRNRRTIRAVALKKGTLLLIEKRELHQIENTGKQFLKTINFYSPPAYTEVEELKAGVK